MVEAGAPRCKSSYPLRDASGANVLTKTAMGDCGLPMPTRQMLAANPRKSSTA